jgi:uncharacterized protein (DUF1015 family)
MLRQWKKPGFSKFERAIRRRSSYVPPQFMATIKPFPALRPLADLAARICELPYDVVSSHEAREIAAENPLSFFHVSKPEIDLAPAIDIHAAEVYAKGKENFYRLIQEGALRQDPSACFYLYRQVAGQHSQVGLVAAASCEDYLQNLIKKHELTRPEKEDDRVRHIEALNSQTGPVFLTYRNEATIDELAEEKISAAPAVDFVAKDGVRHSSWVISDRKSIETIKAEFARVPVLYIADGHHRSAAAVRICQARPGGGQSAYFLAVIFPDSQVQILPYHRVLRDLNKNTPRQLLEKLSSVFMVHSEAEAEPRHRHEIAFYLAGRWHTMHFRPHFTTENDPHGQLDVALLQKHVLAPIFDIDDPRTSKRIDFVGGIRGTRELEKSVDCGDYACAFSLFPTSIEDLMTIADAGGIMPPKSTWFEPKLRDGMFCHMI